jgi:hypothetical protein
MKTTNSTTAVRMTTTMKVSYEVGLANHNSVCLILTIIQVKEDN